MAKIITNFNPNAISESFGRKDLFSEQTVNSTSSSRVDSIQSIAFDKDFKMSKEDDDDGAKKIKVFVLLGQSNMVGMGKVKGADTEGTLEYAVKTKNLYQYLVDDNQEWKEIIDPRVRNLFTMGSGGFDKDKMQIKKKTYRQTNQKYLKSGERVRAINKSFEDCDARVEVYIVLFHASQTKKIYKIREVPLIN